MLKLKFSSIFKLLEKECISRQYIVSLQTCFLFQAYVCQITSNNDYENSAMQQPVVVRGGPVKEIRSFQTEIKLLSTINHQNLVSLLAFSCSNGTGWMIFECPVYGDLNSYLKQQTNDIK